MIHWTTVVFGIILTILLYRSFKDYSNGSGSRYGDISGLINIFWILVTIIFVAIWGGIFWW
jgi:hypothetical protein